MRPMLGMFISPNVEKGCRYGVGSSWWQMGRQWIPTDRITKLLRICYGSAGMFKLIFDNTNFWGRGPPRVQRWYLVPLGMELVSSHRLSIQTTLVSAPYLRQSLLEEISSIRRLQCVTSEFGLTAACQCRHMLPRLSQGVLLYTAST